MVGHSSSLMSARHGLELPWARFSAPNSAQIAAICGEVCTNCNNQNAPFVTKMHKGPAMGSVLSVSALLVLLIDV